MMIVMEKLSDDLYKEIISYIFNPMYELNRYKDNKLTKKKINKCSECNIDINNLQKGNWLHHYCYVCNANDIKLSRNIRNIVCDNNLICWYCIH